MRVCVVDVLVYRFKNQLIVKEGKKKKDLAKRFLKKEKEKKKKRRELIAVF